MDPGQFPDDRDLQVPHGSEAAIGHNGRLVAAAPNRSCAFLGGVIEAGPGFPDPILQSLRCPRVRADYAGPPLAVTTATLASASYCTDRGRVQLPAWEVRAAEVQEPIWVLDPSVSRQAWQPPAPYVPDWPGGTAIVGADGRTITMTFVGSPYFDYPDAEILEAGAAVAIVPRPVLSPGPGSTSGSAMRGLPMVGQSREITVSLAERLADRVLLDNLGSPVMVAT